jgi:hypothetical protein
LGANFWNYGGFFFVCFIFLLHYDDVKTNVRKASDANLVDLNCRIKHLQEFFDHFALLRMVIAYDNVDNKAVDLFLALHFLNNHLLFLFFLKKYFFSFFDFNQKFILKVIDQSRRMRKRRFNFIHLIQQFYWITFI